MCYCHNDIIPDRPKKPKKHAERREHSSTLLGNIHQPQLMICDTKKNLQLELSRFKNVPSVFIFSSAGKKPVRWKAAELWSVFMRETRSDLHPWVNLLGSFYLCKTEIGWLEIPQNVFLLRLKKNKKKQKLKSQIYTVVLWYIYVAHLNATTLARLLMSSCHLVMYLQIDDAFMSLAVYVKYMLWKICQFSNQLVFYGMESSPHCNVRKHANRQDTSKHPYQFDTCSAFKHDANTYRPTLMTDKRQLKYILAKRKTWHNCTLCLCDFLFVFLTYIINIYKI